MASLQNRTGVFSFARYIDGCFDEENSKKKTDPNKTLYRSIKVDIFLIFLAQI